LPTEALSLALAASIYPPALAAVIALGRGTEVRLRVVLFVLASYCTAFAIGALILVLFTEVGATSAQVRTPSAGVYLLVAIVLLWVAARLRRPREPAKQSAASKDERGASRTDRYLQSRWGVLVLAVVLYALPSPIFVGGVKSIVDTHASRSRELADLAVMLLVMLWLIELPIVMLILFQERGVGVLEWINGWFGRHGRALAALAAAALGTYLGVVGLVELLG
jgi:Ca2+/H+ antiporter